MLLPGLTFGRPKRAYRLHNEGVLIMTHLDALILRRQQQRSRRRRRWLLIFNLAWVGIFAAGFVGLGIGTAESMVCVSGALTAAVFGTISLVKS